MPLHQQKHFKLFSPQTDSLNKQFFLSITLQKKLLRLDSKIVIVYLSDMKIVHHKDKISIRITQLIVLGFLAATALSSCQSHPPKNSTSSSTTALTSVSQVTKQSSEISIMEFNVENLFDTKHDVNREDYTFLPRTEKSKPEVKAYCLAQNSAHRREECFETDWNEDVVKIKLQHLGEVIRFVDQGNGPDNLMLEEVENISILKQLVSQELSTLGYQTVVLIEGPDTRGIDPAFISKFPLSKSKPPQLHLIPYTDSNPEQLKWAQKSRGILEVTVQTPQKKDLTFLIAHFPSQQNPTAWRKQAVQFAKNLMADYEKAGRAVIFGGDLNISRDEETEEGFFKKELSQVGQVSHMIGCQNCLGSHNYKGEWSFLDALIFSNNLATSGYEVIPESIEVVRTKNHLKRNGSPKGFRAENKEGVSDHLPLYSRLRPTLK